MHINQPTTRVLLDMYIDYISRTLALEGGVWFGVGCTVNTFGDADTNNVSCTVDFHPLTFSVLSWNRSVQTIDGEWSLSAASMDACTLIVHRRYNEKLSLGFKLCILQFISTVRYSRVLCRERAL